MMNVEKASEQLDALIERRATGQGNANELEQRRKAAECIRQERLKRENAAAWYDFEMRLAANHRQLSEEHEARALALLGAPGGVG